MNTEVKTLKGWNEFAEQTGKWSWCDYVKVGETYVFDELSANKCILLSLWTMR